MPDRDNFYGALREACDWIIQHYHELYVDVGEEEAHEALMKAVEAASEKVRIQLGVIHQAKWDDVILDVAFGIACLFLDLEQLDVEIRKNPNGTVPRHDPDGSGRHN
jgi:hypothetical protein